MVVLHEKQVQKSNLVDTDNYTWVVDIYFNWLGDNSHRCPNHWLEREWIRRLSDQR